MHLIDCNFFNIKSIDQTYKPSSVKSSHLSWQLVTELLTATSIGHAGQAYSPSTVLLRIGLTGPQTLACAGELLPRLSTLTEKNRRYISVALSLGSPPAAVSRYSALRSSDFPRVQPFGSAPATAQSAQSVVIIHHLFYFVNNYVFISRN